MTGVQTCALPIFFDRFAQAPGPTTSGRRGTGLGLAIAKGVVDLHGGTIDAKNRSEGGCVFTVSLPLHTAKAVEQTKAPVRIAAHAPGAERAAVGGAGA